MKTMIKLYLSVCFKCICNNFNISIRTSKPFTNVLEVGNITCTILTELIFLMCVHRVALKTNIQPHFMMCGERLCSLRPKSGGGGVLLGTQLWELVATQGTTPLPCEGQLFQYSLEYHKMQKSTGRSMKEYGTCKTGGAGGRRKTARPSLSSLGARMDSWRQIRAKHYIWPNEHYRHRNCNFLDDLTGDSFRLLLASRKNSESLLKPRCSGYGRALQMQTSVWNIRPVRRQTPLPSLPPLPTIPTSSQEMFIISWTCLLLILCFSDLHFTYR